jgi:S1-C subfamily serine protease
MKAVGRRCRRAGARWLAVALFPVALFPVALFPVALFPVATPARAQPAPNELLKRSEPTALPQGLLESERNTIEIFRAAAGSVVFVTNNALQRDFFSMNVTKVPQGTGSGFVWDRYGHVVTNFHVVEGGNSFSIKLADGTQREATLIGAEPRKDLAVLRFDPKGLAPAALPIGESHSLVVGQKVLAIGNPFGLDQSLTTGIISALGREIPARGGFIIEDVIQTDASINPGNSGGPLIDSRGRLIGVNTAIFSPTGTSAGIGFAVPVDTVRRIVPQLIRFGRVKRAGLGLTLLPDHIVRSWGVTGVVVREVYRGSAAAAAGLRGIELDRRGAVVSLDAIVRIGDKKIRSFADLANALDEHAPGDEVWLDYERDGKPKRVRIRLEELGQ